MDPKLCSFRFYTLFLESEAAVLAHQVGQGKPGRARLAHQNGVLTGAKIEAQPLLGYHPRESLPHM